MKQCDLPFITDVRDLKGKRVLVRASLNVPIENGVVQNYFRIARALPTIQHLTHAGARVIVVAHIGREAENTLGPLSDVLKKHFKLTYVQAVVGDEVQKAVDALSGGEVLLLENVRSHEGETANDPEFARELASYADLYVNDAFPVSHREQASIVGVPQYIPGYFGLTFCEEYRQLLKAITPMHPSHFILGGAKFETKEPLVEKYITTYDYVFVGGALANDFFKAKGFEVGESLVSETSLAGSPLLHNEKLLLPIDVVVEGMEGARVCLPEGVRKDEKILDVGPQTLEMLGGYIKKAETILWNGPLGNYESGFEEYTKKCAELIAASSAHSVVGGGDTIAAIESLGLNDKFGFLSTAGGAMLYFLEKGTLPGIDAVLNSKRQR